MFIINENEREYRFGDSGPKYLMRGPNIDFGLVCLQPGQGFPNHLHERIEENFFILEGEVTILIDSKEVGTLKPGELIHVPPGEAHYLENRGTVPMVAVFVKAPYEPEDKVDVPLEEK